MMAHHDLASKLQFPMGHRATANSCRRARGYLLTGATVMPVVDVAIDTATDPAEPSVES